MAQKRFVSGVLSARRLNRAARRFGLGLAQAFKRRVERLPADPHRGGHLPLGLARRQPKLRGAVLLGRDLSLSALCLIWGGPVHGGQAQFVSG